MSERERARELFVDALIEERYAPGRERVERSLRRALERLDEERAEGHRERELRPTRRHAAWLSGVAAAGLVAWLSLGGTASTASAAATLERAVAVAAANVDRTYAFRARRGRGGSAFIGELQLRGDRRFHGRRRYGANGAEAHFGCDGEEVWVVPADESEPVRRSSDNSLFTHWLREHGVHAPLIRAGEVMRQLSRYEYDLSVETRGDVAHVRAKKIGSRARGPERVALDLRRSDHVVLAMRAEWNRPDPTDGPERVELELISEEPLDDSVFRRTSYHRPERELGELERGRRRFR